MKTEENHNVEHVDAVGQKKQIALTFDDGPHGIYTRILLDGLKERGVHATFFLMGKNIPGNEGLIKRMKEEGHQIGNHTMNHVNLKQVPLRKGQEEIQTTDQLVLEIIGDVPKVIRPPFGEISEELIQWCDRDIVLWNIDPLDWSVQNSQTVFKHLCSHVEDGTIILLHDIFKTSVEAAFLFIDEYKDQYEFVTVEKLMEKNPRIIYYDSEKK